MRGLSDRLGRLQEEIRKDISEILQKQVKDPRLGMVSVTEIELSRDYSHAKVFISVLGDEKTKEQTMEGLKKASGFVRSELGKRIRIRHIPELHFLYDTSLAHGTKISAILRELKNEGESFLE